MTDLRQDRIYSWLGSAIGHKKDDRLKFFFDSSDKSFFNLSETSGQLVVWDKKHYTDLSKSRLIKKIKKVEENHPTIIEISRSTKIFDRLFDGSKDKLDLEKKEDQWKELFSEIQSFLTDNKIQIKECELIES